MIFQFIFSTLLLIIMLLVLFLLLEETLKRLTNSMALHKLKRVIVMPGVIVFVFSILTIITYKIV